MVEQNNNRQDNLRLLRDRLADSHRSGSDGHATWRDRQRQRYLERRLRHAHTDT